MRKKLTEVEQFYVENNPDGLSVKELAKKFNVTEKLIKEVSAAAAPKTEPKPSVKDPVEKKESAIGMKLIGRHKRNGQSVATVMTKSASELGDSSRKSTPKSLERYVINPFESRDDVS